VAGYIHLYEGGPSSVHLDATLTLAGTCVDNSMTFKNVPFGFNWIQLGVRAMGRGSNWSLE